MSDPYPRGMRIVTNSLLNIERLFAFFCSVSFSSQQPNNGKLAFVDGSPSE